MIAGAPVGIMAGCIFTLVIVSFLVGAVVGWIVRGEP